MIQRFVEPSFVKRVAESAFEELVRRTVNIFIAGLPPVTEPLVTQMQVTCITRILFLFYLLGYG
jgi:hypothetical protein